ncbi:hypothetical protein BDA99DRAFT_503836 [Phascolomyces articulosus]|uniref:Zeta toxin domain-containing protein n=1 Tax=Phascolomyces articulosus TaxID=60185 RepID=A0AAD5KKE2_9FUNG|nr:hypothetical protein BDA99DRAFT_503836 [Phascolomyces articulosus]
MLSFAVRTPNDYQPTWCNLHHVQLMLSFIGVKHAHIQEILEYIISIGGEEETFELDSFLDHLKTILYRFRYSNPLIDLEIAWRIVHRQESVCILLGGTSGSGKSTLASLLAHRIGITTVLSTDHVRSLLRSFDPDHNSKVLWASSYHAGENLPDKQVIDGYEAQNQLMLNTLDKMLKGFSDRKESLVIEGVGLSIDTMKLLAKNHPNCIPLVIYISNEHKHTERFAVRAKYMTVAPRTNKYIRYFDNIRLIQNHLCQQADEYQIPKIDNTNVDRSLAILHTTVLNVLARMKRTNQSYTLDPVSDKFTAVFEEFTKVHLATWSSKQMLRRIRQNSFKSSKPIAGEMTYYWKEQHHDPDGNKPQYNKNQREQQQRGSLTMTKPVNVLLACHTRWKAAIKSWASRS